MAPAHSEMTCSSTGTGWYWGCFSSSTIRAPRAQLGLRRLVQVRTELRERLQAPVLREVEAEPPGHRLHGLDLRVAADPRHGDADVDRRADPRVEQVLLQVDLTVGDRDDVGRDVRRHVAALGLDDRQGRQRPGAELVGQLGRALEQPGVQIEHVAIGQKASTVAPGRRQRSMSPARWTTRSSWPRRPPTRRRCSTSLRTPASPWAST